MIKKFRKAEQIVSSFIEHRPLFYSSKITDVFFTFHVSLFTFKTHNPKTPMAYYQNAP